jgi:hypothetical protein
MTPPLVVEQSRDIPVTVEDAFSGTVPIPLPELFSRWYGPIPPIKAVRDQTGEWNAVGQSRTVLLTGRGSMREELTSYDAPRSFGYTLSNVSGPLAPLAEHIEGLWTFKPSGTGTKVTWRWTIYPRSSLGTPLLPVFGRLWLGYARQSLEMLSDKLVHQGIR